MSFASDPGASLGAVLTNQDKGSPGEMFSPSYASIGKLVEGETIARTCGVKVGDCIVAVAGDGFRRFKADYDDDDLEDVTKDIEGISVEDNVVEEDAKERKGNVLSGLKEGEGYSALLGKIKEVKKAADPENPLVLALERYDWDARANAWPRFLTARDGDVPAAMAMMQEHEQWVESQFPIDLTNQGLQHVLKEKAVSMIDIENNDLPPTVYVNFSKLQAMETDHSPKDVVDAFVVFTETLLAMAPDPRRPRTSQFIDVSGASISSGLRVDILKQVYAAFEPNYPETLHKMVMYPVSSFTRKTASVLLSFVNENTQKKFVITDDLDMVCMELGWDKGEVEGAGGVTEFMQRHEKHNDAFVVE